MLDKFARAHMAVINGVNLVIELPFVYSAASAELFAFGALRLLDATGIVDILSFGSESGETDNLWQIAKILYNEPEYFKNFLKHELDKGLSFPKARENALKHYLAFLLTQTVRLPVNNELQLPDNLELPFPVNCELCLLENINLQLPLNNGLQLPEYINLKGSNNILAIEYLKALMRLGSKIKPFTIKRTGNLYNETKLTGGISSATAVRKAIWESLNIRNNITAESHTEAGYKHDHITENHSTNIYDSNSGNCSTEIVKEYLPYQSYQILKGEIEKGKAPVFSENIEKIILYALRTTDIKQLAALPYTGEGLENRLKKAADVSGSLSTLINKVNTKRYTETRIRRILACLVAGLDAKTLDEFNNNGGPQYIRILGADEKGLELLSKMKHHSKLPVFTKAAHIKKCGIYLAEKMIKLEERATDIYSLGMPDENQRLSGRDFCLFKPISVSDTTP